MNEAVVETDSVHPTLSDAIALSGEPRIVLSAAPPFRIAHTNRAWSDATGFTFLDAAGKTLDLLVGPATDEAAMRALNEALMRRGAAFAVIIVCYRNDGTPFRTHMHCELVGGGSHWLCKLHCTELFGVAAMADARRRRRRRRRRGAPLRRRISRTRTPTPARAGGRGGAAATSAAWPT